MEPKPDDKVNYEKIVAHVYNTLNTAWYGIKMMNVFPIGYSDYVRGKMEVIATVLDIIEREAGFHDDNR